MKPRQKPADSETGDDLTLLRRIRQGDQEAFAQLVGRHAEKSYRIAFRFTGVRAEAEDMVQEAFLKLWEQPGLWQEGRGASFATWFNRIVINRCLDIKRKKVPLPIEAALHIADTGALADDRLTSVQEQRMLEDEIANLPVRQRMALNLCFYEELSNKEAAAIMQLPVKAVQSLLMRAKATLKKRLGENHG